MSKRERVYIVDENDTIIGEKWRDETTPSDRIRIVGIWVENSSEQVLIAQRALAMEHEPGLWGPAAAGGVSTDEPYEVAAKRELSEEIGLNVDTESFVSMKLIGKTPYGTAKTGLRMLATFVVKIDWTIERFTIDPIEVEQVRWIDKSKLLTDIKLHPDTYVPHSDRWARYLQSPD